MTTVRPPKSIAGYMHRHCPPSPKSSCGHPNRRRFLWARLLQCLQHSSTCQACQPGSFSRSEQLRSLPERRVLSFSWGRIAASLPPCPVGRFNEARGSEAQLACSLCPVGKASASGRHS